MTDNLCFETNRPKIVRAVFLSPLLIAVLHMPTFAQGEDFSRQEALRACMAREGFTLEEYQEARKEGYLTQDHRKQLAIVKGAICEGELPRQVKKGPPPVTRPWGPAEICATENGVSPGDLEAEPLADKTQAVLAVCQGQIEMTPRFVEAASADLRTCLSQKILRLDDGTSPASDIASAVSPACGEEFEKLMQHLEFKDTGHWRTTETDPTLRRETVYRIALPLVLELRATRRAPPTKQEKPAKRRLES